MRSRKRFLSLLMALFMLLSLFPASALAEEPEGGEGSIQPAEDGGVIAPVTEEDPEAPVPGEAADPDALPPPGDELQSVDFGLSGGTLWNLYEDGTLEIKNSVLHNRTMRIPATLPGISTGIRSIRSVWAPRSAASATTPSTV